MKVTIFKIIKITAGRMHCWCKSNVGRIRKENKNVPKPLWDKFNGRGIPKEWYQKLWVWFLNLIKKFKLKQT